jgi:hypothetical protein
MAIITRAQNGDYDKGWAETFGKKEPRPSDDIPRRRRMDRMTSAEKACLNAISEIEQAGCHPKLTAAQLLIEQAQNLVADFVDSRP